MRASCMSVPILKRIALFFQQLLWRSHYFEIVSRGPAHAHLGSFYGPQAGGFRRLSPSQILNEWLYSCKSYKGGPKI